MHIDLARKMSAIMLKLSVSSLGQSSQLKRCRLHTKEIHDIVRKQTNLRQSDIRQCLKKEEQKSSRDKGNQKEEHPDLCQGVRAPKMKILETS